MNNSCYQILKLLQYFSLAIALVLISYPTKLLAEEKPIGKILSVIGTVKYFTGGADASKGKPGEVKKVSLEPDPWQKVKKRQPVYAKDEFRTSRKSRLKILFADNSLMALGPGAEMSIVSYRTKPKSKLRQGVVNVKRGLSMYIVNKSQKNKKSFFNIVTPTANIGARGTHGYVAASPGQTLIANQAGAVATTSSDPNISGQANVGPMMKTIIPVGAPPAAPRALAANELSTFRNFVVGDIAHSGGGGKSLIAVEEAAPEEEEEEEEEKEEKEGKKGKAGKGGKKGKGGPKGAKGPGGEGPKGSPPGGFKGPGGFKFDGAMEGPMGGGGFEMNMKFDFEMLAEFEDTSFGNFGGPGDFAEVFEFFDDIGGDDCTR